MYKNFRNKKGFTLIETLVSILIVSIAVMAATAALQSSLQTSSFVENQITARYLAADAMEYILALRDEGAAMSQGWMGKLLPCVSTGASAGSGEVWCSIDTYNNSMTSYTSASDMSPLYVCSVPNGTNGTISVFEQQNNTGCTATKFTRTVTIMPIQYLYPNDTNQFNEVIVTVKVSWANGPFSSSESYTLAEDIYNWQPSS